MTRSHCGQPTEARPFKLALAVTAVTAAGTSCPVVEDPCLSCAESCAPIEQLRLHFSSQVDALHSSSTFRARAPEPLARDESSLTPR